MVLLYPGSHLYPIHQQVPSSLSPNLPSISLATSIFTTTITISYLNYCLLVAYCFHCVLFHHWISSVQFICSVVSDSATPWTAACQDFLSITNSQSLLKLISRSWWCHPSISSSVVLFSSCPQSFPASGSFPTSQFFTSGGQSIRASASASVLPMNIQDWFALEWTGWISLQSKGLSRVFSKTTVQKHQCFGALLSL